MNAIFNAVRQTISQLSLLNAGKAAVVVCLCTCYFIMLAVAVIKRKKGKIADLTRNDNTNVASESKNTSNDGFFVEQDISLYQEENCLYDLSDEKTEEL